MDGLDECEGDENQKEVLKVLSMALHQLSFPLRIFVSSWPKYAIQSTITNRTMGRSTIQTIPLDNDYKVADDIKQLIISRSEKIKREHPSGDYLTAAWPGAEAVQTLTDRSQGLFIYAPLVMKYIESDDDHPQNRLQDVLASATPLAATPMIYLLRNWTRYTLTYSPGFLPEIGRKFKTFSTG